MIENRGPETGFQGGAHIREQTCTFLANVADSVTPVSQDDLVDDLIHEGKNVYEIEKTDSRLFVTEDGLIRNADIPATAYQVYMMAAQGIPTVESVARGDHPPENKVIPVSPPISISGEKDHKTIDTRYVGPEAEAVFNEMDRRTVGHRLPLEQEQTLDTLKASIVAKANEIGDNLASCGIDHGHLDILNLGRGQTHNLVVELIDKAYLQRCTHDGLNINQIPYKDGLIRFDVVDAILEDPERWEPVVRVIDWDIAHLRPPINPEITASRDRVRQLIADPDPHARAIGFLLASKTSDSAPKEQVHKAIDDDHEFVKDCAAQCLDYEDPQDRKKIEELIGSGNRVLIQRMQERLPRSPDGWPTPRQLYLSTFYAIFGALGNYPYTGREPHHHWTKLLPLYFDNLMRSDQEDVTVQTLSRAITDNWPVGNTESSQRYYSQIIPNLYFFEGFSHDLWGWINATLNTLDASQIETSVTDGNNPFRPALLCRKKWPKIFEEHVMSWITDPGEIPERRLWALQALQIKYDRDPDYIPSKTAIFDLGSTRATGNQDLDKLAQKLFLKYSLRDLWLRIRRKR